MTATTALTAQNTQGVFAIQETPSDFVKKQINACLDDIGAHVIKIGQRQIHLLFYVFFHLTFFQAC